MARVRLSRTQNNMRDFSAWVVGRIAINNMRQEDVAAYLNLDQGGLSRRISGKTEWKVREMFDLFYLFGETYEYRG